MKYEEYIIRVQSGDGSAQVESFSAPTFRAALDIWKERMDDDWPRYRQAGARYMIMAGKAVNGKGYPLRSVSVTTPGDKQ